MYCYAAPPRCYTRTERSTGNELPVCRLAADVEGCLKGRQFNRHLCFSSPAAVQSRRGVQFAVSRMFDKPPINASRVRGS